jgi:hypothetical protein
MSRFIGTRADKRVHIRRLKAQRSPFTILKNRRGAPSEESRQGPIIDLSALRWRCVHPFPAQARAVNAMSVYTRDEPNPHVGSTSIDRLWLERLSYSRLRAWFGRL